MPCASFANDRCHPATLLPRSPTLQRNPGTFAKSSPNCAEDDMISIRTHLNTQWIENWENAQYLLKPRGSRHAIEQISFQRGDIAVINQAVSRTPSYRSTLAMESPFALFLRSKREYLF